MPVVFSSAVACSVGVRAVAVSVTGGCLLTGTVCCSTRRRTRMLGVKRHSKEPMRKSQVSVEPVNNGRCPVGGGKQAVKAVEEAGVLSVSHTTHRCGANEGN